jgi:phytol kinase
MLSTILLSTAFLGLFGLSELLYHQFQVQAEYTRKLVHIGTGLLTLLFPLLLDSHWQVLFLCGSFAVILLASLRWGYLPSINAIQRKSHGSLCYPIAVYGAFLVYSQMLHHPNAKIPSLLFFYVPVLTMALCDPAAALVGRRWPIRKFRVGSGTKSMAGMATFFIVAVILTAILMLASQPVDAPLQRVLIAAGVLGLTTCLTEAFTPHGLDNFTIPGVALATLFLLDKTLI